MERSLSNKITKIIFLSGLLILQSCFFEKQILSVTINKKEKETLSTVLTSVNISNNQVVINGTGLEKATVIKLAGNSVDADLNIISKSGSQIIASAKSALSLVVGETFNLIIGNADAQATYPITFTLQNGAVESVNLATMNASAGQVLKFNGTNWLPASQIDAQNYIGTWDATTTIPDVSLSASGDYFIVSVAGGGYAIGDWIISDGYNWTKVAYSKTSVSSFNGRKGIVTLVPGDYVSLKDATTQKITGSALKDIADIDLTTTPIGDGQVLKWNAATSKWLPGDATSAAGISRTDLSASAPLSYNSTTGDFSLPAANILALPLTGLTSTSGSIIAADSILDAFGKLQNTQSDYVSKTGTTTISGTLNFTNPTSFLYTQTPSGTTATEVANVQYVGNAISANGVWAKGASSSINYGAGKIGIGTTTPGLLLSVRGIPSTTNYTIQNATGQMSILDSTTPSAIGTGGTLVFGSTYYNTGSTMATGAIGTYKEFVPSNGFNEYSHSLVFKTSTYATGVTERMRIDSLGNVGIGTSAPFGALHINNNNSTDAADDFWMTTYSNTATPGFFTVRARGDQTTPTSILNNDTLFTLSVSGYNGTVNRNAATIKVVATNNFSTSPTADLTLATNGGAASATERMRITSVGNVGIGTILPATLFETQVPNALGLATTAATFSMASFTGTANNEVKVLLGPTNLPGDSAGISASRRVGGSTGFSIYTGNAGSSLEAVHVKGNGNVGIGTNAPASQLDVYGAAATISVGSSASRQLKINGKDSAGTNPIIDYYAAASNPFIIATTVNNNHIALMPHGTGNVGIGTATPGFPLEVNGAMAAGLGTVAAPSITFSGGGGKSDTGLYWKTTNQLGIAAGGRMAGLFAAIGPSNGQLQINQYSTVSTAAGFPAYAFTSDATTGMFLYNASTLGLATAGTTRILIDASGNVGIGAVAPSEKLHVVGNLRVQGSTDCILGNGAGGTSCSSDIRLKEHIEAIQNPLTKILSLRGVEFDWNEKSQSPGRHDIGVIAQDVEKVFPTAVIQDSTTGYKKVDYAVLVAPIIQAFKEVYKRITDLFDVTQEHSRAIASMKAREIEKDKEIAQLKKDNAEVKERLNKLEKLLR